MGTLASRSLALVRTGDLGYLTVNSEPVTWAMVNAIKELKAENNELRARLAKLEGTVGTIASR